VAAPALLALERIRIAWTPSRTSPSTAPSARKCARR
jgi:hypothetical protein